LCDELELAGAVGEVTRNESPFLHCNTGLPFIVLDES
jgi:hypothetical protein